jgi:hypothetical protein
VIRLGSLNSFRAAYTPKITSLFTPQHVVIANFWHCFIGLFASINTSMKNKRKPSDPRHPDPLQKDLPGYPPYPESDDIYNRFTKEGELDPEDPSQKKIITDTDGTSADEEVSVNGDDLDVPGSDLDDDQERIGSEDEENNYYSLGGDNHIDLDERTDPRS